MPVRIRSCVFRSLLLYLLSNTYHAIHLVENKYIIYTCIYTVLPNTVICMVLRLHCTPLWSRPVIILLVLYPLLSSREWASTLRNTVCRRQRECYLPSLRSVRLLDHHLCQHATRQNGCIPLMQFLSPWGGEKTKNCQGHLPPQPNDIFTPYEAASKESTTGPAAPVAPQTFRPSHARELVHDMSAAPMSTEMSGATRGLADRFGEGSRGERGKEEIKTFSHVHLFICAKEGLVPLQRFDIIDNITLFRIGMSFPANPSATCFVGMQFCGDIHVEAIDCLECLSN